MPIIFFLFATVSIVEIWALIEVGSHVGILNTIILVIITAVIGIAMLRIQGLSILARVRSQMAANQLPAIALLEGLLLLAGGALLLIPGFITDAVGFICLFPATRTLMARALISRFAGQGYLMATPSGARRAPSTRFRDATSNTIEGEYRRED